MTVTVTILRIIGHAHQTVFRLFPSNLFPVAINKGKTIALATVIGSGDVRKGRSIHVHLQIAVIKSTHAFIAKNPGLGGIYPATIDVGGFKKCYPTFGHILQGFITLGVRIRINAHKAVHGNAADAIAIEGRKGVGRARINTKVIADIVSEQGLFVNSLIGVGIRYSPIFTFTTAPTIYVVSTKLGIENQCVLVIQAVHGGGNLQLPLVAQTFGGDGVTFGLGQGGQQHGGEDGDDGDDDEQLDQGEGALFFPAEKTPGA